MTPLNVAALVALLVAVVFASAAVVSFAEYLLTPKAPPSLPPLPEHKADVLQFPPRGGSR